MKSFNYFEAVNRDNVDLVDLKSQPIECITPRGIRTAAAEVLLDIIVFATGFDAMTGALLRMDIRGRDGRTLADAWAARPRNYLGLQVAGFPNLFMMTGPGSPSVLCNMPVPIEQHAEWIADCIAHMRTKGLTRIETSEAAMDDWVEKVNATADAILLSRAKHSWYYGANIPGKPQVFMPYAGGMARYKRICDEVVTRNREGFVLGDCPRGRRTASSAVRRLAGIRLPRLLRDNRTRALRQARVATTTRQRKSDGMHETL